MRKLLLTLPIIILVAGCNSARQIQPGQNTNAVENQSSSPTSSPNVVQAQSPTADSNRNVVQNQSPTPLTNQEDTSNWKSYSNQIYGFKIMYPQNWPINFSGNILTLGDSTAADHPKCYLTITFNRSKEGSVIPAPFTYNEYTDTEGAQKCGQTLKQIISSYKTK